MNDDTLVVQGYTMHDLEMGEALIRLFIADMTKKVPAWQKELESYVVHHATEFKINPEDAIHYIECAVKFTEFQRHYRNTTGAPLVPNEDGNYMPLLF